MTERKPPDVSFGTWVEQQIRDAGAREDFARLPGAGRPLPRDMEAPYDEMWWVKRKPAREGHSVLPPTPALRKEAEDALGAALAAPSERIVRRILTEINVKIRDMMFKPPPGPRWARSRTTSRMSYGGGGSAGRGRTGPGPGTPDGVPGRGAGQARRSRSASSR